MEWIVDALPKCARGRGRDRKQPLHLSLIAFERSPPLRLLGDEPRAVRPKTRTSFAAGRSVTEQLGFSLYEALPSETQWLNEAGPSEFEKQRQEKRQDNKTTRQVL